MTIETIANTVRIDASRINVTDTEQREDGKYQRAFRVFGPALEGDSTLPLIYELLLVGDTKAEIEIVTPQLTY